MAWVQVCEPQAPWWHGQVSRRMGRINPLHASSPLLSYVMAPKWGAESSIPPYSPPLQRGEGGAGPGCKDPPRLFGGQDV